MKTSTMLALTVAASLPLLAAEKIGANTNSYWEATAVVPAPKAAPELAWVDDALARFAANYTVLLTHALAEHTAERPYPKSFKDGRVRYVPDWDWCSGFWPGALWYLYEATDDLKWRLAAERYTDEQSRIRYSNLHHDLGFMFLPSAGNGLRITGDGRYAGWLYDAARTLQTRYRPNCRCIQVWGVWGGK